MNHNIFTEQYEQLKRHGFNVSVKLFHKKLFSTVIVSHEEQWEVQVHGVRLPDVRASGSDGVRRKKQGREEEWPPGGVKIDFKWIFIDKPKSQSKVHPPPQPGLVSKISMATF